MASLWASCRVDCRERRVMYDIAVAVLVAASVLGIGVVLWWLGDDDDW